MSLDAVHFFFGELILMLELARWKTGAPASNLAISVGRHGHSARRQTVIQVLAILGGAVTFHLRPDTTSIAVEFVYCHANHLP